MKFNELDSVRTLKDFPEFGINKGDTGTVVIVFTKPQEGYEVEFDDEYGRTKAIFAILPDYLELYY